MKYVIAWLTLALLGAVPLPTHARELPGDGPRERGGHRSGGVVERRTGTLDAFGIESAEVEWDGEFPSNISITSWSLHFATLAPRGLRWHLWNFDAFAQSGYDGEWLTGTYALDSGEVLFVRAHDRFVEIGPLGREILHTWSFPDESSMKPNLITTIQCAVNTAEGIQQCAKDCKKQCSRDGKSGVKKFKYSEIDSKCGSSGDCECTCK